MIESRNIYCVYVLEEWKCRTFQDMVMESG